MKKPKVAPKCGPVPLEGRQGMKLIYAELLDKQMQPEDFEKIDNTADVGKLKKPENFKKMKQSVKFRPTSDDVNHRFGKRAGST